MPEDIKPLAAKKPKDVGPVTKGGAVVVTIAQLETARTFEEMEPVLFAGMRTPKVGT
jgi:hypothetical protein